MKQIILLGALFAAFAFVTCNDLQNINIDELKSKLPEGITLPESLNNVTLPSADDVKNVLKQKCEKVSGNAETFEGAEAASTVFVDCVTGLVNVTALQQEIEQAQPNGELDTVFNKYCRKRNTAIDCMKNFTEAIDPCLEEDERKGKTTLVNIFTNLLNFVCHKDGDQIALFIAEKGPECFTDKKDALINCINSTLPGYVPSEAMTLETLPHLVMGQKQCDDMNALQTCIVTELESCQESTPANLVESMFKFIRNETPCVNMTQKTTTASHKGNGAVTTTTSVTLLSTVTMAVIARILLK